MTVAALAAGGWFIYSSHSLSGDARPARASRPKPFEENIPVKDMEDATQRAISDAKAWSAPVRNNKAVPLFKSVLLVLKDDQIYDMFLDDPPLRPPLTNKWLRENNLTFHVSQCGGPGSGRRRLHQHRGIQRKHQPERSQEPPSHHRQALLGAAHRAQIPRLTEVLRRPSLPGEHHHRGRAQEGSFVEIGKPFGVGGRFVAKKFEKKEVQDPKTRHHSGCLRNSRSKTTSGMNEHCLGEGCRTKPRRLRGGLRIPPEE